MPVVSTESGRQRVRLVATNATSHDRMKASATGRGRSRRSAAARSGAVLLPHWNSSAEPAAEHAATDGALALLDHPHAPRASRPAPARHHILVVEDDPRVARVIRETLELEGEQTWTVQIAGEGLRALQLAGNTPPDVVLLDVRLPDVDGAEVYRQLRANRQTRGARVLFLTAGTSFDLYQRGIEDGVVLRKPFDVRELASLVRALLAG